MSKSIYIQRDSGCELESSAYPRKKIKELFEKMSPEAKKEFMEEVRR